MRVIPEELQQMLLVKQAYRSNVKGKNGKPDTIYPKFVFKSGTYCNVKCFSFRLPYAKTINELELYTDAIILDTCSGKSEHVLDTISFKTRY